ncbi:MAG: hypothetical protein WCP45_17785 [Verrucomicrobiota bacterium]
MNSDDYAKKQAKRDADYEREYKAWVKSLPADELKQLEKSGLASPCLQRHGNGAPDHDMAESSAASYTPDIAAMVDHETENAEPVNDMRGATRILRHLVADLVAEGNTRLTIECLAIALGLRVYAGDSMTEIANRHGVTRAAVSKRCVDITTRLNLQPSRAMRSKRARQTYRNAQLKRYRRKKP